MLGSSSLEDVPGSLGCEFWERRVTARGFMPENYFVQSRSVSALTCDTVIFKTKLLPLRKLPCVPPAAWRQSKTFSIHLTFLLPIQFDHLTLHRAAEAKMRGVLWGSSFV